MLIALVKSESSTDPIRALRKPSTTNPGVKKPANINSKALITNENNPSVKKLTGNEINSTNGLIKTFINEIIMQTSIALRKLSTLIPGTIQAINTITSE